MDGCLQGKKRGTWYTSFPYVDWTGKRCRKLKRGFLTKKEAQNWENHFKLQKANSLDMTFEDFYGNPIQYLVYKRTYHKNEDTSVF